MILPGSRVMVFDVSVFENDILTPLSKTMKLATVLRRYGKTGVYGTYPDLVDVVFDHNNRISHEHFTRSVKEIQN